MNLPNKLTILRIILVLPLVVCLAFLIGEPDNRVFWMVSGSLFVLSMATDYVDGFLARKHHQVTTFGKLFDPLADKFVTSVTLIMLSVAQIVPFYITLVFVLRDLLVDGSRNLAAKNNLEIAASKVGKWKTMVMSVGITLVFFVTPFVEYEPDFINPSWTLWVVLTPLNFAALLSVISGYEYFRSVLPYINSK